MGAPEFVANFILEGQVSTVELADAPSDSIIILNPYRHPAIEDLGRPRHGQSRSDSRSALRESRKLPHFVTVRADRPTGRREPTCFVTSSTTLITVTDGPRGGKSIETAGKPVRIGTSSDNQLVIDDELVSRQYGEIIPTPNGILVRDNGSTNGTFHGAVRLLAATFCEPFSLRIGATTVCVSPYAGTVDLERSTADPHPPLSRLAWCAQACSAWLTRGYA